MAGRQLDTLLLLATGALWGSAFIAIRAGIVAGASPFLYAAVRFALATAIMGGVALASRAAAPPRRELLRSAALGAFFLMGGYSLFLYWGEQTTSGSLSTILVATAPLQSALIAYPLLPADRFGRLGVTGVLLGFAGVATIFLPQLSGSSTVDVLRALAVFGAASLFSVGSVILRRLGGGRQGPWLMTGQFAASAVFLGVVAATTGAQQFPVSAVTVGTVVYLAAGSSVLGYGLYFLLHHRVGPQRANLVAYVNPVVGVALGVFLLGESVAWTEIAGFGLVIGGLALLHFERRTRPTG